MKIINWFIRIMLIPMVFLKACVAIGKKTVHNRNKIRKRYKTWVSIRKGLLGVLNMGTLGYTMFTLIEPHLKKSK